MEKPNTSEISRLLNFREVGALIGSRCKTGHVCLTLAARGQLQAVRLNARVVRYTEASVRLLIEGKVSA